MKPQSVRIYLIRASLCLALASSLTVLSFHLTKIEERIQKAEAELKRETTGRRLAETQLATANATVKETTISLEAARQATVQAAADALAQSSRAEKLARDLTASYKEKDQTKADLARYQATEMQPEQIVQVIAVLKKLRVELAETENQKILLEREVGIQREKVEAGLDDILLPAALKTKVLLCDPKWGFVILDAGAEQGVVKNAELLVSREGKLVGKVRISKVQKNQSIGNLVSGWQLSDILEGDFVIPAFVCQN